MGQEGLVIRMAEIPAVIQAEILVEVPLGILMEDRMGDTVAEVEQVVGNLETHYLEHSIIQEHDR